MIVKEQNIFSLYLELLEVKHTKAYSNKYYEEHPHNANLYGLSQMLTDYGVENLGLRLENTITNLQDIEPPYIVQVKGGFGIVSNVTPDKVEYYGDGKKMAVPHTDFLRMWSGVVLVGETDEKSIEPNYPSNHRKELITSIEKITLFIAAILLLGGIGYTTGFYHQGGLLAALLINGLGVYISYLLVLKQMKIHSRYGDKLCSLFLHEGDCNDVLESDGAKLFGTFSWSEIGLGYFVTNLILITCFPGLYPYLTLVNVCFLPFTLWSVWYQKAVVREWCGLCLFVQATLWLLFVNNLAFGLIVWPTFTVTAILLTGCLYIIPILLLNLLIPRLSEANRMQEVTQKLNNLKADEEIFRATLNAQAKYEVDRQIGILMGNPQAKHMITVVTNPHCNPCAKMHARLEQLMKSSNNSFCLQYMVTSFNDELTESSMLFISMYKKLSPVDYESMLSEWFRGGKDNREAFYAKYPFDREDPEMLAELKRHQSWQKEVAIFSTPTVLFNGYKLPDKYKVEDLGYFTEMSV
ncbi:vitamin K epoxide reductase family protein [Parabacteroides sp. PF5-9]|uniref:vitamin K epoxide reductase family protein n=1 Tax=Parabacteroides sp. PF5-9 TaxID=1742404 RepID=UPI0024751E89|nr:vitamin K epoxide reductase family protein [Parabacteroides sp. PF5-9]MDH6359001.1 thiol-disulfide isomerase/thioredoxin [Parabacteroides sp. PF5-9]